MTNAGRHPGTSPRPAGSGGELHSSLTATPHPSEEGSAHDRPAVGRPGERADLQGRNALIQGVVGVIDEVIVVAVRRARRCALGRGSGRCWRAQRPAAGHRAAAAIEVRTGDRSRPADHDLVGAVRLPCSSRSKETKR